MIINPVTHPDDDFSFTLTNKRRRKDFTSIIENNNEPSDAVMMSQGDPYKASSSTILTSYIEMSGDVSIRS